MKFSKHIIVSFSTGLAVWLFAKSLYGGVVCFLAGSLIDIDHIVDYTARYGWRASAFKNLWQACEETPEEKSKHQFKKIYLIFHSVELALILWAIVFYTRSIYFFSGALGYSLHLVLDWIGNKEYPQFYFLAWRAINKFCAERLLRGEDYRK